MTSTRTLDPNQLKVILATDCGSTTTKAILIEEIDGVYRQTYRGEAPTTVEEPAADVTIGVSNAAMEVGELAGRRLVDEHGLLIRPAQGRDGCDAYLSTSSAGGGLQMLVCGVVKEMTGASAERAALGAGAIVMDVLAVNDGRKPFEQIQRIRDLRPDMILLAGGTDGGTVRHVVQMAELIAPAKPQARFGKQYQVPLIFAGNAQAEEAVAAATANAVALTVVPNVRPVLERENLAPARDCIHDLFLEHVMAHAPGYDKLIAWADAPIMPTPGAVGDILQMIASRQGINAVGVDIGGATTDVFSVFHGEFHRTVSANLGMSYSISNVCAEAGLANLARWIPFDVDERSLRNLVKNKMIRPTTIPQTFEALLFEQAVAREALRLSYLHHKSFAVDLRGVQKRRSVSDLFRQQGGSRSIVDEMSLNLLVASGGVLSHAPEMSQTAAMLIDAFEPAGVTRLAKDSIFMMPHLGVLAKVHPKAALDVFERDCLIELGACIAPSGRGRLGQVCLKYRFTGDLAASGELRCGDVAKFPLGPGEWAEAELHPSREFDVGNGPGRSLTAKIAGGTVGVLLDGRGRPLAIPGDRAERVAALKRWHRTWGVVPDGPTSSS